MSVLVTNNFYDQTSDANFRLWGAAMKAIFEHGGFWQQAADTGQINWTTVTRPGGSNLVAGFEIYETIDTLSSTFKMYMKVEFGNGSFSGAPLNPQMRFSFGSGTNGAGTLTGNVSNVMKWDPNVGSQGTTKYPYYVSAGAGRWGVLGFMGPSAAANLAWGLVVERGVNASGAYHGDYITWVFCANDNNLGLLPFTQQRTMFRPALGTFGPERGDSAAVYHLLLTTAAVGNYALPFTVYPMIGFFDNPMISCIGMKGGDINDRGQFSAIMYGAPRSYIWSNRGNLRLSRITSMTDIGFGIRWE